MGVVEGHHLLLDGRGLSVRRGSVGRFLRHAVAATGLTPISPVFADEVWGVGMVVIAESHISVHLAGDRGWADVFSCRPFAHDRLAAAAREIFGGQWTARLLRRDGAA